MHGIHTRVASSTQYTPALGQVGFTGKPSNTPGLRIWVPRICSPCSRVSLATVRAWLQYDVIASITSSTMLRARL